jgi:hypothetical protein
MYTCHDTPLTVSVSVLAVTTFASAVAEYYAKSKINLLFIAF